MVKYMQRASAPTHQLLFPDLPQLGVCHPGSSRQPTVPGVPVLAQFREVVIGFIPPRELCLESDVGMHTSCRQKLHGVAKS